MSKVPPRHKGYKKSLTIMNIAFICTGEFEPFFYECMAKRLEKEGINIFYVGFFLDTRRAINKINRCCYPLKAERSAGLSYTFNNSCFSSRELDDIIRYDYTRLKANGIGIEKGKLINKTVYYESFFNDFYSKHDIKAIVIWNSFPLVVNVAWRVAARMNIKNIFFENGPLPNTLMIDTKGINYQSSLAGKTKEFYENVTVDEVKWQSFMSSYGDKAKPSREKNKGIMNYPQKLYYAFLMRNHFYRNLFPDLTDDRIGQSLCKKIRSQFFIKEHRLNLPEHFIFLPFQYPYDTQILINSPNINTMELFLRTCHAAVRKGAPSGYKIVVKEHPDDLGRTNYGRLRKDFPDVIWFKKYDIESLIDKAEAIITINSSVGVLALMRHKPVVTLGNSFYNIEGIVYNVNNLDKLVEAVKQALEGPLNKELIDKFVYYLRFEYLVEGSPRYCNENSLHQAYEKIKSIL